MKTLTWAAIGAAVIIIGFLGYRAQTADAPDATQNNASGAPGSSSAGARGGRGGGGRPAPLVVARPVSENLINDRLKAVGNGTAQASVSVVPLSGGVLTEVLVAPGQQVEAGTVLAKLDAEEQQIALDRAASEAQEAESDAARLEQLYRSRTTTRVELNRARAALTDAQLALRDAELKLSRRTISAPIAGIVGFVSVDTGNYVTAQTELMTIDDRSKLVVEFWVPERFANQVSLGQTVDAVAMADPGTPYQASVNGIGSRIERDSRTLPIKALVDNSRDSLRPGMSFELLMRFPGQSYPAVNPLAIQWDSTGSYVWQIVDDKVQRVAARVIQRNPEAVLVDAQLAPGDMVVTEGLLSLRQGAAVRTNKPAAAGAAQGKPRPPKDTESTPEAQQRKPRPAEGSESAPKAPRGRGES